MSGLLLLSVGLAHATRRVPERPDIVLHEPTEIAWLLAGLTPLGQGGDALNRNTPYWQAAQAWFAPHRKHRAVLQLGGDFNLPRLIGNAANFCFDTRGHLVADAGSRPMWGDATGDLFSRNRRAIEAFALDSGARMFLVQQRDVLDAARATLASAVDLADMQAWLETEFTARPGPMHVYVSPLTGGWNFTNLDPRTPRLWIPSFEAPASDYARFRIVRSIFTEMDHNHVNPLTTRLGRAAYRHMTVADGWATREAWADYGSPELVVNEYLTFAAFVAFAQDRISSDDLNRTLADTKRQMQRRGFVRFGEFSDALTSLRRARPGRLEQQLPGVLAMLRGH